MQLPKREPNGRHTRSVEHLVETHSPAQTRRLRDAALRNMASAEWATEIGRLLSRSEIDSRRYEVGKRFAALSREYHFATAAPGIRGAVLVRGQCPQVLDPDSPQGQAAATRHLRTAAYDDAIAALGAYGPLVLLTCERDKTVCGHAELRALQVGLTALGESRSRAELDRRPHTVAGYRPGRRRVSVGALCLKPCRHIAASMTRQILSLPMERSAAPSLSARNEPPRPRRTTM